MAKFLKRATTQGGAQGDFDGDHDRPDCPNWQAEMWQAEMLKAQLRIDALKCERSRQLLKRLDD